MPDIPWSRELREQEPPSRSRARIPTRTSWAAAALGVGLAWIAYQNGAAGLTARSVLSIGVWWTLAGGLALGLLPRAHVDRAVIVVASLLAAFAVDTFASVFWAADPADALAEFNRVSLYLGLFLLVVLAVRRRELGFWADGLTAGLVATGVIALVSRLDPDLFSDRGLADFLPSATTRLSFPIGYWNGLGILMGITIPLCLRGALAWRRGPRRSLAVLPVPMLVSVLFLTSSRGGFATAFVAAAVFFAATNRRWEAAGAIAACAVGSAASVAVLLRCDELVNGPLDGSAAVTQGHVAAALLACCCLLAAGAHALGVRVASRRAAPSRLAGQAAVGVAVVAALALLLALDPPRRFDEFTRSPSSIVGTSVGGGFARAHLLSGNGNGRWQFWGAAFREFRTAHVLGRGAGSYESWWATHASFPYFVRNAHSLYLETLGDLGAIGFLLIAGAFGSGLGMAGLRVARAAEGERPTVAGLTAVFAAFAFSAAIDWTWQVTIVAAVGVVALALVGACGSEPFGPAAGGRPRKILRVAAGAALLVLGGALVCASAIPWLASLRLGDSEAAFRRGDGRAALAAAADARSIEPWAAAPYLQLALVEESSGRLDAARRFVEKAIDRDPENWRLWLVAARLDTKAGLIERAEQSLARAAALNPRSPAFSDLTGRVPSELTP